MKQSEIYWKPSWTVGLEHLTLYENREVIEADGLVLVHFEGEGLRMRYHVTCDPGWCVRQVEARLVGDEAVRCWLAADGHGGWLDIAGQLRDDLTGCIDVDIMATPFTNTLPICRLDMPVGESQEIDVVYIKIPDLKAERASQRYTCLSRDGATSRYLYQSIATDFKAELLVDAHGLVVDYQGIWERVTNPS